MMESGIKYQRRQQRFKNCCIYVAKNRNSTYKDIDFDHLIPLPFYLSLSELSAIFQLTEDTSSTVEKIFNAYKKDGGNLYNDWMRYVGWVTDEDDRMQALLGIIPSLVVMRYTDLEKKVHSTLQRKDYHHQIAERNGRHQL